MPKDPSFTYLSNLSQAIERRDLFESRKLLREFWITVQRINLPLGPVWVIGGTSFFLFQQEMICLLTVKPKMKGKNRLVFGKQQFWSLAVIELWETGNYGVIERRLSGILTYYLPETYLIYGKLLLRNGRERAAAPYLMLSGLYSEDESHVVEQFKRWLRTMQPNQVVSQLPRPSRVREIRYMFNQKVTEDLASTPCPSWFYRQEKSSLK